MPKTKEEKWKEIHQEALKRFDKIFSTVQDEREQCLEDRRFYSIAGAQWEGDLEAQFANKPRFEVNKIHLNIIRIINEYRNNKLSVVFEAPDDIEQDFADNCTGLYRADEKDSIADEAYDNAFEEAVGGGIGAWRLRACYEDEEDEENEYQVIRFEPIFDADSCVFFDIDAKRQDKADAKYCFVLTSMSKESFEEEYGEDVSTWEKQIDNSQFDWTSNDSVYIAEYYLVEYKKDIIRVFRGLTDDEVKFKNSELDEEKLNELELTGYNEVRQKPIKRKRVHKYLLSGNSVLEDCGQIAGSNIPIVPVYGKRWFIDNIERCMGHVRLSKDAQRLKNMQLSKLGELSSLSSVEKPIFLADQVKGFETEWSRDAVENYAFLRINGLKDPNGNILATQPVGYTKAPSIPPAMAALLELTEKDMQDLLGNQQQGEVIQPNTSGLAVELVQNKLDMQSYIYLSNMSKAKKRSGEIWLSMAKDLLVEEGRELKSLDEKGTYSKIVLQRKIAKDDEVTTENDLSKANFKVTANIGPSSDSKRKAIVRALTGIMGITQDAETQQVIGAMVMLNMEGEGISDVRSYFRKKLVKMGVLKPTESEMQELLQEQANQPPDPNAEYLKAAAIQAEAEGAAARAKTVVSLADAEKKKAEAMKILADMDLDKRNLILEVAREINSMSNTTSEQKTASTGSK